MATVTSGAWGETNADTAYWIDPERRYSANRHAAESLVVQPVQLQNIGALTVRRAMTDEEFALDNYFAESGLGFAD